jgi:antibiotic biosynthesis monooxygenase (ABM) superfamily enzyme
MSLTNDFIEAVPLHLRDELFQVLQDWMTSNERKAYIDRNHDEHRKKEIEQMRRRAMMRQQIFKPEKV